MQSCNFIYAFLRMAFVKAALTTFIVVGSLGCMRETLQSATPIVENVPLVISTSTAAQPTSFPTLQVATATNIVILSQTATPTPTSSVRDTILFEEDFEDGRAQGFNYMAGNWNVITDEIVNKVLDGDNRLKSQGAPSFEFGSLGWTDYALEYDIKMRNPTADVWLGIRNSNQGYYAHRLSQYYAHMSVVDPDWNLLKSRTYEFTRGIWYHVRLEAQGETIRVFIDEKLEIETTDSQVHAGDVTFQVMAPTHVQLDNILVTGH